MTGSIELRIGVSSFGYSGTNSHAVLSSATEVAAAVVGSSQSVRYEQRAFTWNVPGPKRSGTSVPLLGIVCINKFVHN